MRFEGRTLQEALEAAAKGLQCSLLEVEYEIISNAKRGFLASGGKTPSSRLQSQLQKPNLTPQKTQNTQSKTPKTPSISTNTNQPSQMTISQKRRKTTVFEMG